MKEKGKHFLQTNSVLSPTCIKGLPNQVFVTTGNGDIVDPKIIELLKEDNSEVTDEGFYSNQNVIENGLNQGYKVLQRQKSQIRFPNKIKRTQMDFGLWKMLSLMLKEKLRRFVISLFLMILKSKGKELKSWQRSWEIWFKRLNV